MRWLLFVVGVLFALWGALLMLISRGAVHEVQAYVCWLTAVCAVGAAGIIEAVQANARGTATPAAKAPRVDPHRYPE